jgi:dUTP pyrophosphatase
MTNTGVPFFYNFTENDRKIYAFLLGRLTRQDFYISDDRTKVQEEFEISDEKFDLSQLVWKYNNFNILNMDREIITDLVKDIIIKKIYLFDLLCGMLYITVSTPRIFCLNNYVDLIRENLSPEYMKLINVRCEKVQDVNFRSTREKDTTYIDFLYNLSKCPVIEITGGYDITFTEELSMMKCFHFTLEYLLSDPNAIPPEKARFSDTGYDLHLMKKLKEENGIVYYTTGVRVKPEKGYYLDIVPRSSLIKMGWTLANNVGIIDNLYRGDLIIALNPVGTVQKELVLPFKAVQAIPRKVIQAQLKRVETLDSTDRGDSGGLGSRNFK